MKIKAYLASLLPSFSKERVTEDCRIIRGEIKEYVIPATEQAAHFFKTHKFKSAELEPMLAQFKRMVKGDGNDNPVTTISKSFKAILDNLDTVEERIEQVYSEEIAGGGFTYLKANLLQFVECIHFVSKFSLKFMNYVWICETAEYEEGGTAIAESLAPAEIEWLKTNFLTYCTAFNVVTGQPNSVKHAIADIPDIVVTNENADTLQQTQGRKVDPFQMGLIPIWLNPVYHVGMLVAEYQASRYRAAKEKLKLLQLRRINMEKLVNGKPDATVQKQIKYMESRISDMEYEIAKMEGKVQHG